MDVVRCKNKNCQVEAEPYFKNMKTLRDVDHSIIGCYCKDCFSIEEEKLKELRFVEKYKYNKIYTKDGGFSPYWQSHYYFKNVEGARAQIDSPHIAVVDPSIMEILNT